ncbi:small nucleolar ribonucleoprotein complex [Grosmannia clavigera kw1407]|uniref:Small nucleolar ribonucleoprotein complex n=1 Tax=Grosmannia clavigera (strain kw1407 / UAMH 11150) TaxID=655863 RepID=F0XLX4_GROCL|nr:small nucleolar ribonucleoprotein complex [Grosmannia clavigera kw1407]EFX01493.1 small nucleolar ribonucleoprotein complex [Grosmannia clavigera kw1407]
MATKLQFKTTFEAEQVIRPIYTGGSVALDNGSRILATTLGEDAVLTDLATGKLFAKIEGDGEPISTLILTPSASHLIVCSRSLTMRIYRLQVSLGESVVEPTLVRTVKPHATPAVVLAVDRTSTLLATGAADGNIKVWDIRGGFVTHTFRGPSVLVSALHFFEVAAAEAAAAAAGSKKKKNKGSLSQAEVATVAAGAEGKEAAADTTTRFRLAAGSQGGKVRVWDLHRRVVVANLDGHVSDVQAVAYSAVHQTLLTAGRDKTMIWWDAQTWTSRRVVPTFEMIEAAGFLRGDSDDDKDGSSTDVLAYTAGANGCVRLWETRTGREVTAEQPTRSDEEAVVAALYRPQQAALLCVQLDQTLVLYPMPMGDLLSKLKSSGADGLLPPLETSRRISGTHDDIIDLAFLLPDRSLMALATNSEDLRIVSVGDASSSSSSYFGQDVAQLKGHSDMVITLDVDWSGHWVATGSKDNNARLWRVDGPSGTSTCHAVFAGHAESVGAVGLPKTAPAADSAEYTDPLSHPPAFLVTGSQDLTIKRWEVPRTASASSQQRAVFTRKAHDKDINAVDVDAHGQLFASSSQDRTAKIWSVREGEVQGILRGHRRGVWSVRFAPAHTPPVTGEDGTAVGGAGSSLRSRLVLTGSADKTVKIWSLADYSCIRTFEGHTNSILKVVWLGASRDSEPEQEDGTPNGPVLFASAGSDGLVKVWDASAGEAACTLDNHEDRVWALAVHTTAAGRMLVSGGGDATITFWRDTTAVTAQAAVEAVRERVEHEQLLANYMRHGALREAVTLALQLNQPGRLLAVLSEAMVAAKTTTDEDADKDGHVTRSGDDSKNIAAVLASLDDDQLYTLLLRVRDWNTNGRSAAVAQFVLATLVHAYPAATLAGLARRRPADPTAESAPKGPRNIKDVLDALLAYTQRHYRRTAELLDESYLVDYTLREMDALQALPPPDVSADLAVDVAMTD